MAEMEANLHQPRRWRRWVAAGLAVPAFGAVLLWGCWGRQTATPVATLPTEDPRLTYETPFLNVRPNVQYVGDQACAQCHAQYGEWFHKHPMGQSLTPTAEMVEKERYDPKAHNPFEATGLLYTVDRRGKKVFHRETLRDSKGKVLDEMSEESVYALGSSANGRSYIINRGGFLYQSPISWFEQGQRWDISPSYEGLNFHYDKPIHSACLFCHANPAEAVPHTNNQFKEPIFPLGYSIGCERCHGPGELHVAARDPFNKDYQHDLAAKKIDYTIVNPKHLAPSLRESVCQQCHLQGTVRVLRRARDIWDFRPGLPLHFFYSVYVQPPSISEYYKAVGQVEQMYSSKCFQRTKGKRNEAGNALDLGCIVCHDPHRHIEKAESASFYRARCLKCHEDQDRSRLLLEDQDRSSLLQGNKPAKASELPAPIAVVCKVPLEKRQAKQNSCIACHMPRLSSADVAHTAITDHRILRKPEQPKTSTSVVKVMSMDERLIVHFHRDDDPLVRSSKEFSRDYGIALVRWAREDPSHQTVGKMGLPVLEDAVKTWPDDVMAMEYRAWALVFSGRLLDAVEAFKGVLEKSPKEESTLRDAAMLSEIAGQADAAVDYWRRAIAINPTSAIYRSHLAKLLHDRKEWKDALEQCEATLKLNLANVDTRKVLITCCIRLGDRSRARREFEKVVALIPKDASQQPKFPGYVPEGPEKLQEWFAEQMK